MVRLLMVMASCVSLLCAADFTGTWKLNTAKSKYEGMPAPKEQTVTYTAKGAGYHYEAKGVAADGKPIAASFDYLKDGEEIKATGFPLWDGLVLKNGTSDKSTAELRRGGKAVGTVTRTVAKDGKSMVVAGSATTPDGKKATYHAHYDRQ